MNDQSIIKSQLRLKEATLSEIAEVTSKLFFQNEEPQKLLSVKDVSGNSGAKTYICNEAEVPKCIVKVKSVDSIMNSHPNTTARVAAATKVLRGHGIAPPILMEGHDFHIERSAGTSVMKDFFHFDQNLAPPENVAKLLAKVHSSPISWYEPLKRKFLERDLTLKGILEPLPPYAPCWCLPWSGFDTGMPILGVGNPNIKTAKIILELLVESGVYKKVMECSAFHPESEAARRQVVVHNDFKPDNILIDPDTSLLNVIDYDLVQVGSAVMDFGLPYTMWLGSRFTNFKYREAFIKSYLNASNLPLGEKEVTQFMLDCEVNTIVAFPGLLANLYDAEVPLLRGIKHPTAKPDFLSGGSEVSPTGIELVDLLADAVFTIKSDKVLINNCLKDGLVMTMFKLEGFGSKALNSWLKEMQRNKMLRLFGIAETDDGELYVSEHARN